MSTILDRLNNLDKLVGKTPLVEILFKYHGKEMKVYTKLEYYNYTGSIKDRMALHILKKAYNSGLIKDDYTIIEATSGNTGISFSALGSFLGNPVKIIMPDWMSNERKLLLKAFGANIELVSKSDGGFIKCVQLAGESTYNNPKVFLPSQFSNEANVDAHFLSTGPEIYNELNKINKLPNAFIAGVGTGGTVMGVGKYLKYKNPFVKIYPLEPSNSPTLSTGYVTGHHRIQGISDEFIPKIIKLDKLDEVINVDDGDSIIMAQMLSSKLGLGVGISSGANFIGAIKVLDKLGSDSIVVTVFPDDNKKYLTTDLMKIEPIKDGFISSNIELLEMKVI